MGSSMSLKHKLTFLRVLIMKPTMATMTKKSKMIRMIISTERKTFTKVNVRMIYASMNLHAVSPKANLI